MESLQVAWEDIYLSSLKFLLPLTPQQTYKIIVREVLKLLNADEGTILLYRKRKLERIYATPSVIKNTTISSNDSTHKALKTKKSFTTSIKKEKDINQQHSKLECKTVIFIPLSYAGKDQGILNIFFKKTKKLCKEEILKLQLISTMISLVLYKTEQLERTEEAVVARDLFISMASHELKNPLTSIIMTAQLIKMANEKKQIPDTQLLNSLITQSLWLSKFVNEILHTRNIRNGKLNPLSDTVQLLDVINLALTTFKASHRDYRIILVSKVLKEDTQLEGDFYKLFQVYINILNNAAKFSSNQDPIIIMITKRNKSIETKIIDQGIGIAKKDLSRISEGFYGGGMKNHEGMGLGLYLVKKIIDSVGGQISLASKLNKGTIVTVSLPCYVKNGTAV